MHETGRGKAVGQGLTGLSAHFPVRSAFDASFERPGPIGRVNAPSRKQKMAGHGSTLRAADKGGRMRLDFDPLAAVGTRRRQGLSIQAQGTLDPRLVARSPTHWSGGSRRLRMEDHIRPVPAASSTLSGRYVDIPAQSKTGALCMRLWRAKSLAFCER